MDKRLSFLESPYKSILEKCHELIPGIERIICYYHDEKGEEQTLELLNTTSVSIKPVLTSDIIFDIHKLKKGKALYNWVKSVKDIDKGSSSTHDLFSEKDNRILILKIENPLTSHLDIFFFYFRPVGSNFGLIKGNHLISPQNKELIGILFQKIISLELKRTFNDRKNYRLLITQINLLKSKHELLDKKINSLDINYKKMLTKHFDYLVDEASKYLATSFTLSNKARETLLNYQGDLKDYEAIVSNAAQIAANATIGSENNIVTIDDWHLDLPTAKTIVTKEISTSFHPRYGKALALLDKFENSAREIKYKKLQLTSVNVGKYCPTPISAPAITDALKSNRKKINILLNKYPEKWPIIRNEFRPLINITDILEKYQLNA